MSEGFALKADVRERTGKGAARALRREGLIPAVIYGNNEPPVPIAVSQKEMTLALYAGGFLTNVWTIDVGGKSIQALARDYQREPVKDRLVHIDFLRVSATSRVSVDVPVHFVGEEDSPGLKTGGVLSVAEHTLTVDAPATRIPDALEVSIAGLEVGATIMSSDITLPEGVTLVLHHGEPVAIGSIMAPVSDADEDTDEVAADDVAVVGEDQASDDGDS
ncbi:MAG: 50S ribosomal protein L25/general stress protein Ctc [Acuticoccus sp.]